MLTFRPHSSRDNTIGVCVGKKKRRLVIDKNLLFSRSRFFKDRHHDDGEPIGGEFVVCTRSRAFCKHSGCVRQRLGDPDSGARAMIEISTWPDIDPDAFETYSSWLYDGSIPIYPADKSTAALFRRLVKAHSLGEAIKNPEFLVAVQNAILSNNELIPLDARAVKSR
jgi:hypothetical protein